MTYRNKKVREPAAWKNYRIDEVIREVSSLKQTLILEKPNVVVMADDLIFSTTIYWLGVWENSLKDLKAKRFWRTEIDERLIANLICASLRELMVYVSSISKTATTTTVYFMLQRLEETIYYGEKHESATRKYPTRTHRLARDKH